MIPSSATLDISLERPRLVRLCAQFVGDLDAAEDLAQETLLEAWRNLHKLHNPAGHAQWLSAIARNVCQRWAYRRGREAHLIPLEADDDLTTAALGDALTDDFDIELELEREELARLLDRAMAFLPPDIRAALVARYVEESPLAEVAARLGVSEGAVKMRLQRGKLALRSVLMTDLIDEAAAYGLIRGVDQQWQETRIWCTLCGQRRLVGRWTEERQLKSLD